MRDLVEQTKGVRSSKYHRGYLKAPLAKYRGSLPRRLRAQAPDIIKMLGVKPIFDELADRIETGVGSADTRIMREILRRLNKSDAPAANGHKFNIAAENFYWDSMRARHRDQALAFFANDARCAAS